MNKIRVLLANHPMMVPDVIHQLVMEQDDMELVGDTRGPMSILREAGRAKADAVILGSKGGEEAGLCEQLLAVYPDLTILGVRPDMTSAFTQKLCSHQRKVEGAEMNDLALVLRTAVNETTQGRNKL